MTSELKTCPFCGGEAQLMEAIIGSNWWVVTCTHYEDCPIKPAGRHVYDTEADAIDAWNRRAKPGDDKSLTDEEMEILNDMPALKRLAMIAGFEVER